MIFTVLIALIVGFCSFTFGVFVGAYRSTRDQTASVLAIYDHMRLLNSLDDEAEELDVV